MFSEKRLAAGHIGSELITETKNLRLPLPPVSPITFSLTKGEEGGRTIGAHKVYLVLSQGLGWQIRNFSDNTDDNIITVKGS